MQGRKRGGLSRVLLETAAIEICLMITNQTENRRTDRPTLDEQCLMHAAF